jgi:hypothetical protein
MEAILISYVLWRLDPSLKPGRFTPRAPRQEREFETWLRRPKPDPERAADLSREAAR